MEDGDGWVDATFEGTTFPTGVYGRQMVETLLDRLGKKRSFSSNTLLLVVTASVQPTDSPGVEEKC